jgi:hypothetical protein
VGARRCARLRSGLRRAISEARRWNSTPGTPRSRSATTSRARPEAHAHDRWHRAPHLLATTRTGVSSASR